MALNGFHSSQENVQASLSNVKVLMAEATPSITQETLSVVGKSHKGTAFVPSQILPSNIEESEIILNTFKGEFGTIKNNLHNQGYLGGITWLENSNSQLSFCRILGLDDESGFRVGDNIISGSLTPDVKGPNSFAVNGGIAGKTYFFGKFIENNQASDSISAYNDYFEQLGYSNNDTLPIVSHVIMMPSGTVPSLRTSDDSYKRLDKLSLINDKLRDNIASNTYGINSNDNFGSMVSIFEETTSEEVTEGGSSRRPVDLIYINGLSGSNVSIQNSLHVDSFDLKEIKWQDTNKLNIKSLYQIDRGNFLYAKFPYNKTLFKKKELGKFESFIVSGSISQNYPDFEDFKDTFKKASTPWVVSQIINRSKLTSTDVSNIRNSKYEKLFKFHSHDDGEIGNRFRIRIRPKQLGGKLLNELNDIYSKFDITIFELNKNTHRYSILSVYDNLDLNPDSPDYIGRILGTEQRYFDSTSGKIIVKGDFTKTNPWLYVEVSKEVEKKLIDPHLVPCGFEEYPHINLKEEHVYDENNSGFPSTIPNNSFSNICQTPIEFIHSLYKNNKEKLEISEDISYWGVSFDEFQPIKENLNNKRISGNLINENIKYLHPVFAENNDNFKTSKNQHVNYSKYFKSNTNSNKSNWIEEDYQNSFFHLEKIMITKNTTNVIEWKYAQYRRDGKEISNIDSLQVVNTVTDFRSFYKYLNIGEDLNNINSKYMSFDLFTYGGFDGLDIFDRDKFLMNNNACFREEKNPAENSQSTINSINLALNLVKQYENCTTDILSVPGISSKKVLSNFSKINDTDDNFIQIKEINPIISNDFITDSLFLNNKVIPYIPNNTNNAVINSDFENNVRINSSPFEYFDYINKNNKNELIVYNNFRASINTGVEAFEAYIGSSIPVIKIMSRNKFSPLESYLLDNSDGSNVIDFIDIVDSKYKSSDITTEYTRNKNNIIKNKFNTFVSEGTRITLSSSNSTFESRNNINRLIYNTRILNRIKKNIKLALFMGPDQVLFNQNSKFRNIAQTTKTTIDRILQAYKASNIIKNYYTKIEDNHNIKDNMLDLERYVLKGSIFLELNTVLNGDNITSVEEISLEGILSSLSLNKDVGNLKEIQELKIPSNLGD